KSLKWNDSGNIGELGVQKHSLARPPATTKGAPMRRSLWRRGILDRSLQFLGTHFAIYFLTPSPDAVVDVRHAHPTLALELQVGNRCGLAVLGFAIRVRVGHEPEVLEALGVCLPHLCKDLSES